MNAAYGHVVVDEGVPFESRTLSTADRLFILERFGGNAEVKASTIRIGRYVGHLRLPSGATLSIRSPKAPAASIIAWQAYTDRTLRSVKWDLAVEAYGAEADIAALIARLFLTELRVALTRFGVPRSYAQTRTQTSVVRGRIEFGRLLRLGGDLTRTPCTTWERRPASKLAQTMAATLMRIERDPIMRLAAVADLRVATSAFQGAIPRADTGLLSGTTLLERHEQSFAMPLHLAKLILQGENLGDFDRQSGAGYLVNLESLFEKTVVQALDEAGLGVKGKAPVSYIRVRGNSFAPIKGMQMDAYCPTLAPNGVVIDAKYKTKVDSANLQQVVAYCFVTGSRIGVLAVPSSHSDETRAFVFRDGRGGEEVWIHVVHLPTDGVSIASWQQKAVEFAANVRNVSRSTAE